MSKWYASCFTLCLEEEREPDNWTKLHVGATNGTSCPALAGDGDNFLLQKHWEWQEEGAPRLKHGSVMRPTLCLASLDIKTAFDEAGPRHVAKSTENHDRHGWLIAALLREMSGLEGKAMFECVRAVSLSIDVSARGASKLHIVAKDDQAAPGQ